MSANAFKSFHQDTIGRALRQSSSGGIIQASIARDLLRLSSDSRSNAVAGKSLELCQQAHNQLVISERRLPYFTLPHFTIPCFTLACLTLPCLKRAATYFVAEWIDQHIPTGRLQLDKLRAALERSVVKRLMTDVPYVITVSLDIITALMCNTQRNLFVCAQFPTAQQ